MDKRSDSGPFFSLGGGCLRYLLAALLVLFAVGIVFGTVKCGSGASATAGHPAAGVIVGGVVALAAVAVFRLMGPVVFDVGARRATLPPLVPWARGRRDYSLDGFHTVTVARETRYRKQTRRFGQISRSHSLTVYVLYLDGGAADALELRVFADYLSCRRHAEALAEALHFSLVDRSEREATTRAPAELDETYVNRVRRTATPKKCRGTADPGRIETRQEDGTDIFELPRGPDESMSKFVIGLLLLGVCAVAAWQVPKIMSPRSTALLVGCSAALLGLFRFAYSGERVTVLASGRDLRIVRRYRLFTDVERISTDELEELLIVGVHLVARADRRVIRFGAALNMTERAWLHDAITRALLA